MCMACAAWALAQEDPGLGNYQHSLPGRGLGMKYQKELSNTIPGRWEALWQGCQHLLPEPDHNMTILAWAV